MQGLHRMRHRAWRRMRLLRALPGMLLRRPLLRMLFWYMSWLCRMLLGHRTWLCRMLPGRRMHLLRSGVRLRRMLRSGLLVHRSHFVQITHLGRTRSIVMLYRRPVNG